VHAFRLCFYLLAVALVLGAQDVREFEKKITEFTLANGLHFILAERHEAPVVSFHTYVRAGAVDDPAGQTGLAHMFEHLAFKGTETIGTKNWSDEKKAMDAIEEVYDRLDAERNKAVKADQSRIETLQTQLKVAVDRADLYVLPNDHIRTMEENGGVRLNASAGLDSIEYACSLPSNRLELWFLLESQRFLHPVFRQFYGEREVVLQEYRQQVESRPQGLLTQSLLSTAFAVHPYRNPPGGWPSDIASLRRGDARTFFDKYFVPGNITIAIVGDVDPAESKRMAERYFGPMQAKPLPPIRHTQEPPQPGPKIAAIDLPTQPIAAVGYKRPDQYDQDDAVFDVIQLILSGPSGLLYKEMVEDKRLTTSVQALATFPGGRYPNLFTFLLAPSQGHTVEENEKALDDLLAVFQANPVDAGMLERAKTQARAGALRMASSNSGLARLLVLYYAGYGDWRTMFTSFNQLDKVTADDVQRVARKYFVAVNRTTAYTAPPRPPAAAGGKR